MICIKDSNKIFVAAMIGQIEQILLYVGNTFSLNSHFTFFVSSASVNSISNPWLSIYPEHR